MNINPENITAEQQFALQTARITKSIQQHSDQYETTFIHCTENPTEQHDDGQSPISEIPEDQRFERIREATQIALLANQRHAVEFVIRNNIYGTSFAEDYEDLVQNLIGKSITPLVIFETPFAVDNLSQIGIGSSIESLLQDLLNQDLIGVSRAVVIVKKI